MKFSENPQFNFEWFCYLLFCKEFNKPYGIFRYKNQSAIETQPIEVNGECVGFQSKFYETKLSDHKTEFLEMIDKANRDYSELNRLIIYTNQEWAPSYKNDEKGVALTDTLKGKKKLAHVNEFGLYNLIFESRKPEARNFKRWVTHEVLPSIYKNGEYSVNQGNQESYRVALGEALRENEIFRQELREYDLLKVKP